MADTNASLSEDLFGRSLIAYSQGYPSPYYLKDSSGKLFKTDLSRYFRSTNQISGFEKKLTSLAYGEILDVGCGTGNYHPLLIERGDVLGIDISPLVIEAAREQGCRTCKVGDIFAFRTRKRFDTITFLGNNLGIAGSVRRTGRLLRILADLLKDDGQILALGRRVVCGKYVRAHLRPVWRGREGRGFYWIHISRALLADQCVRAGLRLSVVQGNQHYYLFRMQKITEFHRQ